MSWVGALKLVPVVETLIITGSAAEALQAGRQDEIEAWNDLHMQIHGEEAPQWQTDPWGALFASEGEADGVETLNISTGTFNTDVFSIEGLSSDSNQAPSAPNYSTPASSVPITTSIDPALELEYQNLQAEIEADRQERELRTALTEELLAYGDSVSDAQTNRVEELYDHLGIELDNPLNPSTRIRFEPLRASGLGELTVDQAIQESLSAVQSDAESSNASTREFYEGIDASLLNDLEEPTQQVAFTVTLGDETFVASGNFTVSQLNDLMSRGILNESLLDASDASLEFDLPEAAPEIQIASSTNDEWAINPTSRRILGMDGSDTSEEAVSDPAQPLEFRNGVLPDPDETLETNAVNNGEFGDNTVVDIPSVTASPDPQPINPEDSVFTFPDESAEVGDTTILDASPEDDSWLSPLAFPIAVQDSPPGTEGYKETDINQALAESLTDVDTSNHSPVITTEDGTPMYYYDGVYREIHTTEDGRRVIFTPNGPLELVSPSRQSNTRPETTEQASHRFGREQARLNAGLEPESSAITSPGAGTLVRDLPLDQLTTEEKKALTRQREEAALAALQTMSEEEQIQFYQDFYDRLDETYGGLVSRLKRVNQVALLNKVNPYEVDPAVQQQQVIDVMESLIQEEEMARQKVKQALVNHVQEHHKVNLTMEQLEALDTPSTEVAEPGRPDVSALSSEVSSAREEIDRTLAEFTEPLGPISSDLTFQEVLQRMTNSRTGEIDANQLNEIVEKYDLNDEDEYGPVPSDGGFLNGILNGFF